MERRDRFLAQTFRDGRDRIRVRERVFDRRPITRILAEQSRVGAVQGGDDPGRTPPVSAQHLHREIGRGRVRHGVMHMKNIELLPHARFEPSSPPAAGCNRDK